ncbi:unnamed protein product [Heligmosomoides polygyrus]|uniref:lysozyme n=1 Tax=Heligmosomoides polygyrus TaxID=6339 RepID=A0A183GR23_HELPZ|nr:unnamed protein product [Heligmosomoides polygyrus]
MDKCLDIICRQESGLSYGCRLAVVRLLPGNIEAIKKDYYIDCGTPGRRTGEDFETPWNRCADDYTCSTQCVKSYVNRYKSHCTSIGEDSCEAMARLHNGGPFGCNKTSTDSYWNKIKMAWVRALKYNSLSHTKVQWFSKKLELKFGLSETIYVVDGLLGRIQNKSL